MSSGKKNFYFRFRLAILVGLLALCGIFTQTGWAAEATKESLSLDDLKLGIMKQGLGPEETVTEETVTEETVTEETVNDLIFFNPAESRLAQSDVTLSSGSAKPNGDALLPANSPGASTSAIPAIPTICTTRPSFTDSWLSIPQGSFQAESGASYIDYSNKSRMVTVPETLLKLGVGKNTEFRFSTPSYTYLSSKIDGQLGNHLGDMTVGMVQHFALPKAKLDIALIPVLNLPTGANRVSSNALDPQLRVIVARTMTPKLTLATQFDARWNRGKNRATDVMFNPTLIGYYAFTPKHVGFLEYAGLIPTQGKNQQFIQAGYLYVPTPRQQWDIRIATGLNRQSPDVMVGFGYSFRVDGLFGDSKSFSSFLKNK
jgi:hypothetical protein